MRLYEVFILISCVSGFGSYNMQRNMGLHRRRTIMMPIGVPKVAYQIPGTDFVEWVDIYSRLNRDRIIFLGQEINDEISNQIIALMLHLDIEDSKSPIYLYINCPGGSVISGLALYDAMNMIKAPIVTMNIGMAASMASFLLAAGEKGHRMALPHSRIMIHQPMSTAQGQAQHIQVEAEQVVRIKANIITSYAKMTGQSEAQISQDINRNHYMSAQAALEYGIIDRIIETS